ncbi:protein FAM83B-like isoform X2 [Melanotaenia boesemani]|uniref:protein FAM83B-like isoform X2 n=1 Tax=Melanotaenia boesemani TaxID=1250792 RepID=UPI001C057D45|nr:protein FAM83B-like isoform X2 [Melanotaenia boesemani]
MESSPSSLSLPTEDAHEVYVQPHYKESYRLAIYALLCGGKEAYEEYLRVEQLSHFLSEEEILFILENAELPVVEEHSRGLQVTDEGSPSTYFPAESDEEVPDLDLGWPEVALEGKDTSISLLFHPPRQNTPTIKEVVRRQIQEAHQVIAIAMDVFTDVDIFKETVGAALRGVKVYILLDDSQVNSFLKMSHGVGVNIHDIKNLRVRTVQGQQYQCRSGMKFHGGLEQKFMLVDCRTVLYGTYSYTWSFEKINLSMVLVVTGQLVGSYDEEFRRLYAHSVVPAVLSERRPPVPHLRDPMVMRSPNSSQLSLNQVPMRSRMMQGLRSAQSSSFSNGAMISRGLSVQERLHQSHVPDGGNLVRGHSYGGELQKVNSMTRVRMGTKDFGIPVTPERAGSNLRGGRASQQQLRHQTRYGADHNLIPFNSETSLHRWKMDTYLNESDMLLGASYDGISPMISPHSSHMGLNELQSQLIHSRSRDIKSRMEETRQKRLSLQETANLRQSKESLRSVYSTVERTKGMTSMRGLDVRQSVAELVLNTQNMEDSDLKMEGGMREQILTDGHRSVSHYDIKTAADRKMMKTNNWQETALSRTKSDADLDVKLTDAALKLSLLHSSGLSMQQSRVMESLTEIPEEKEVSNTHVSSLDSSIRNKIEEVCKAEKAAARENGETSVSTDTETTPKMLNGSSTERPAPGEAHRHHTEKDQTGPELQRNNSARMKVHSLPAAAEKKEKSLQRRTSLRSSPRLEQPTSAAERTTKKGHSPQIHRSQNSLSGSSETEKQKDPFSRPTPQRFGRRKINLDNEGAAVSQAARDRVYSRYELLFSSENASDKDRNSSLKRSKAGYPLYPTQTASDNKLGRFMQRVGNLINKNK